MKKSFVVCTLVASLCLSLLAGCGSNGATTSGTTPGSTDTGVKTLNIGVSTAEASMDPIKASDSFYVTLLGNTIGGLYTVDENNQLQLDLAQDVKVSDDGLEYTFTIRDNAVWSDGTKVTANDFVFAWRRLADPTSGTQYAYLVEEAHLKNAAAVTAGEMATDQLGVSAVDDKTLKVELDTPTPFFASMTAFSPMSPLNEAFVTAQGDNFALTKDNLLFCGAYNVTEWDVSGNTVTIEKNKDYWDAANVDVDRINFKVVSDPQQGVMSYENGDLDRINLSGDLVSQYQDNKDFSNALGIFNWYMYFNAQSVTNEKLRQAMAYAVDRDALVQNVLKDGSVAQHNVLMTGLYTSDDGKDFNEACGNHYETNKDKAKELWAEAQKETDMRSITITYDEDNSAVANVAAYVQSEIEGTLDGLKVELKCVPKKTRIDNMKNGDYDVALHRWGPDYSDASCIMSLYTTGSPYNYSKWSDAKYDQLLDDTSTKLATDPEARWNTFVEAENVLSDAAVCVPLFQVADAVLTKEGVKGITNHITGVSCYYKYVTME